MKPMSPEAQQLVDEARAVPEAPPEGAQQRIRAALAARIADGDPGPSLPLPGAAAGTMRRVLLGLLLALGVAVGLLGKRSPEPAVVPTVAIPPSPAVAAASPSVPAPPPPAAAPAAVPPPPEAPPQVPTPNVHRPAPRIPLHELRPAPSPEAEKPAPDKTEPEKVHEEKAQEEQCGIAGELKLLQRAQHDLQEHKADEVLTALQQASRACPGEGLEQERLALRILALCQLGRADDARTGLVRLEKEAPQSPSLGRIHAECDALLNVP